MSLLLISPRPELRARWRQAAAIGAGQVQETDRWSSSIPLAGHRPELVLLHLPLTERQRLEPVRALRQAFPQSPLLVLADHPSENEGISLLKLGVMGYCNSHIAPELLNKAVLAVRNGEVWAGRKLIQRLIANLGSETATAPPTDRLLSSLTEREREIAHQVARGQSNKAIGEQLDITERTVKSHLSSIFHKIGIQDRLQLALLLNRGIDQHPPIN